MSPVSASVTAQVRDARMLWFTCTGPVTDLSHLTMCFTICFGNSPDLNVYDHYDMFHDTSVLKQPGAGHGTGTWHQTLT